MNREELWVRLQRIDDSSARQILSYLFGRYETSEDHGTPISTNDFFETIEKRLNIISRNGVD